MLACFAAGRLLTMRVSRAMTAGERTCLLRLSPRSSDSLKLTVTMLKLAGSRCIALWRGCDCGAGAGLGWLTGVC